MRSFVPRLADGALSWLSPPRCAACDAPLPPEQGPFCAPCEASLEPLEGPRCARSGAAPPPGGCRRCRPGPPPCRVIARFAYGGALARGLRRFKYAGRLDLVRPLAALLAPALAATSAPLVPVPSAPGALRRRGYDPLWELLRAVGGLRGRVLPLLRRADRRAPQVGRSARERRTLPADAFRLRWRAVLPGGPLCLVDDVITTGATLRAAAAALAGAGAGRITAITLARSIVEPGLGG